MVKFVKMSSVFHTCGVTEDNFSRRSLFDKHVKLHDNSSPSFCDSCGKIYGNDFAFNEHVKRYHLKEFPCSQCDQKFPTNVALKRHMRIHNKSSDNFPCDVCSKTFSRLDSLNRHKMESCNSTRARFRYDMCHEFK